jgi:hypothetical protein
MSLSARRTVLLLVATLVVGIGGLACGGSDEATDDIVTDDSKGPIPTPKEARQALNEALQAFNRHCIAPRAQGAENSYPLTLFNPNPSAPSYKYRQLQALAQAGLLTKEVARDERDLPVHRFALTEAGRSSQYDIAQARRYKPMFCYATPHVARLDSIKSVYTSDPKPLANVWFVYTYRNLGRWAESASIQRTFSGMPPLPSSSDTLRTEQLLIRADSAWVDRRLTGYDRPPDRPSP